MTARSLAPEELLHLRFDDTLETVLAADLSTPIGVQSAWRQLVDLVGRRRVPADVRAMARLRAIRDQVPLGVRAASARALEYANPPALLVRLFALDDLRVAMPVMRTARMTSSEWTELLPDLAPSTRSILRNRRDLGPAVKRALESFGPIDFVLPDRSAPQPVIGDVAEMALHEQPDPIVATPPEEQEPEIAEIAGEADPDSFVIESPASQVPEPTFEPAGTEAALGPEFASAGVSPPIERPAPSEEAPSLSKEPAVPDDAALAVDMPRVILAGNVLGSGARYELGVPRIALGSELTQAEPPVAELGADQVEPATDPVVEPVGEAITPAEEPATEAIDETPAADLPAEPDLSFIALAEGSLLAPLQTGTAAARAPIAAGPEPAQGLTMDRGDAILGEAPEAAEPLPTHNALPDDAGTFEIADVVARIDAFWRNREGATMRERAPAPADAFRFETDAAGVIRWVEGVSRGPVIGVSLDLQGSGDGPRVDGVATGGFRRRAGFANARMVIEGESDAAGDWRISAVPVFDPANGRFTGYRGTGRRPRADERAEPQPLVSASTPADSLRQLVHELRTPTNAIAGFAEMIETQMLGPVPDPYRHRAGDIRAHARELLGAIDDLDLAARIDSSALALVPGRVALRALLAGIADDLSTLADLRGASIALPIDDLAVNGDRRAVERLLARLMATLVSASGEGERIGVRLSLDADEIVTIAIDRPKALADYPGESVFGIDDEHEDAALLGTGFALRLARNLARELGGSLVIEPESLTLRLPAAVTANVDQAHLS